MKSYNQGDDNTTGYLLYYPYFNEIFKLIATDLSKQQVLDANPKVIQKINFSVNLKRVENTFVFFIIFHISLNLPLKLMGYSKDETNFPYKLLLTDHRFWGFLKLFQMIHEQI